MRLPILIGKIYFRKLLCKSGDPFPIIRGNQQSEPGCIGSLLNTAMTWTRNERKHVEKRESMGSVSHFLKENTPPKDERLLWLYEEIAKLNAIDRSLTLLLLDGFSYKEMATMLGISESNVGVKVHRIKKHLMTQAKKLNYHGI